MYRSVPRSMRGRTSLQLFVFLLLYVSRRIGSNPLELGLPPSCGTCDQASCEQAVGCSGGTVPDSCSCCQVCAKLAVGERCVPGECDESAGLMCIPDDPYAAVQIGTCQELSPCLTFGCEVEDGQCHCSYSNKCPLQAFSYSTLEECQDNLQSSACDNAECPSEDCPEGMTFDPGFVIPGECCPVGGSCMCDFSQCDLEPMCPNDTQTVLVAAANETDGQCCDVFQCRPVDYPSCEFHGVRIPHGDMVELGPCTTCQCSFSLLNCIQEACPLLNCASGSSFIPEGQCCPVCFPFGILDPTPSPSDFPPPPVFSNCISLSGLVYADGERWKDDACTSCRCRGGQVLCSSIQCEMPDCDNPAFLPDVCCPVCPDVAFPFPTSTLTDVPSTQVPLPSLPPLLPQIVVEPGVPFRVTEVVVVLDIPYDEYLVDESHLSAMLKDFVSSARLDVSDMKASAYGRTQTHIVLDIMVQKRALMSDKDVAVMVAASTEGDPVVYRVGTVTDIPAVSLRSESEGPEDDREDSSDGGSQAAPMVVAVAVSVSLVAILSLTAGAILAAVVIARARRKSAKTSKNSSIEKKSDVATV